MAKIKLKGRPQSTIPGRTKKVDVRFTTIEYAVILSMSEELGISKSELIRKKVLGNAIEHSLNRKQTMDWLDSSGLELSRAGNNINQLARYANILGKNGILSAVVAERFNIELQKYQSRQKDIEKLLRKIIFIFSA